MKLVRFYGLIICLINEQCAINQDKNRVVFKNVNLMKLENCEELLLRSADYNDGKIFRYMTQDTCKKERKSVEACQKYRSKLLDNEIAYQRGRARIRSAKYPIQGGSHIDDPDEYPYMVALGYFSGNESYEFRCGGSIISTTFVLTAAHCIDMDEKNNVKIVRIGTTIIPSVTREHTPYDHKVKKPIHHPEYNKSRKLHDIGLIQLHSSVDFRKSVKPVCLYTENDDPATMEIVGWGVHNFEGQRDPNLRKAGLRPVARHTCEQVYGKRLNVKIESCHICAGDNRTNICKGDSGGPLLIKGTDMSYQVGVISHGEHCGSRTPGLYARVSSYLNWIEDIVWNGSHY